MSSAASARSVFASVPAFSFAAHQYESCRDFLAARTANTESVPIVDESQLLMSADGRIAESGYRFNSIGFRALASYLSVGLAQLFNELSGENVRNIKTLDRETDIAAAVSVYNTTLRVRFEALRERSLLVNHKEQTIDGFLGLDHRMLDNSVFLDTVISELQAKQPGVEFFRSELLGRELRLYFIDPTTQRSDIYPDKRHTFAGGWYCANREDTGNAVRANTCLYTRFGVAVEPAKAGARLNHTGADLIGRTAILVSRAADRAVDMALVAKRVSELSRLSLGLSDDKATNDAAYDKWATYLAKFKIYREDALQVLKNAALVGSDLEPRDALTVYTKEVLKTRTAYDLFCSMLRCSRGHYHVLRDQLQATALQILLPDIKIKKRK